MPSTLKSPPRDNKVIGGIERGAHAAGRGIDRAGSATERGVNNVSERASRPVRRVGESFGRKLAPAAMPHRRPWGRRAARRSFTLLHLGCTCAVRARYMARRH